MADDLHGFSPEENQADVDARHTWPIGRVLEELFHGYRSAATEIDRAGGRLDGVGLGEWVHSGDVREPIGAADPYTSPGVEIAFLLLLERSTRNRHPIAVEVDGEIARFGSAGDPEGRLRADMETFVRLCTGRRPDPMRYQLSGVDASELVLFN